jgi:ABC-type uncharacterized transport system involved in gliding motility auxiliary subunit
MEINRQETTRLLGFVGAAMLVAGYVRYAIEDVWGKFNLGLVIAGAILLLASIVLNFGAIVAFFRGRQGRLGANTAVLSIAVVAILGILNFLGYRHHKRFDLTAEGINSLSEQTIKILGNLPRDVSVIRFETTSSPEGFRFADLMSEFKYAGRRFSYERVDPQEKPEIARQYAVTRAPDTVVASGDRIEHVQTPDEQSVVNAILKVTRDKLKRVCFTEGHGERATSATEGEGLAIAEGKLKNENYETKTINLAGANQSLSDCDVVVVAGPKQSLLPPETAALGKYLEGGGKVMLMLDPETDPQVGDLLKPWNIEVGDDFVLDVSAAGQMFGGGPTAPLVMNYGAHPITQNFGRTMTIFPDSRSVKVGSASGTGVNGTTILSTSEQSWAETELKAVVSPQFDQGKDQKGPVNLGVAASKSVGENKEARLVVIGDSDFATNRANRFQRNGDLFANSINWLAQDEDLISIRPKAAANRTVTMNESQQNMLFWFVVLLMPLAVAGTGGYIWWKRR